MIQLDATEIGLSFLFMEDLLDHLSHQTPNREYNFLYLFKQDALKIRSRNEFMNNISELMEDNPDFSICISLSLGVFIFAIEPLEVDEIIVKLKFGCNIAEITGVDHRIYQTAAKAGKELKI